MSSNPQSSPPAGVENMSPKERDRARRISKAMCECVHFNGIQHGTCKVGVTYTDVSDKSVRPYGFPCLQVHVTTCPKREHPTLEAATAEIDEWDRAFTRVNTAMKAICPVQAGAAARCATRSLATTGTFTANAQRKDAAHGCNKTVSRAG
jgi:hypothetical protein